MAQTPHPARDCVGHALVPSVAPDTIPGELLDSLGSVEDSGAQARGARYAKNLVALQFKAQATQPQRQAAVDRVCGTVAGGDRETEGEGFYLVRLRGAETVDALIAATNTLRAMPAVAVATTIGVKRPALSSDESLPGGEPSCYLRNANGGFRVQAFKEMLVASGSDEVRLRTALGLAGTDTSDVVVVDDPGICGKVIRAVNDAAHMEHAATAMVVLRAGPRYVAFDPLGLTRALFFVDTTFHFRNIVP